MPRCIFPASKPLQAKRRGRQRWKMTSYAMPSLISSSVWMKVMLLMVAVYDWSSPRLVRRPMLGLCLLLQPPWPRPKIAQADTHTAPCTTSDIMVQCYVAEIFRFIHRNSYAIACLKISRTFQINVLKSVTENSYCQNRGSTKVNFTKHTMQNTKKIRRKSWFQ